MDDLSTYALLITSAFFVVLSFSLLYRYRQVSKEVLASNDLGRDLWAALETRLKKQDERILDMMGRVEVIQSRALEKQTRVDQMASATVEAEPVEVRASQQAETVVDGRASVKSQDQSQDVTSHKENISAAGDSDLVKAIGAQLAKQDEKLVDMINRLEAFQSKLVDSRVEANVMPALASEAVGTIVHRREGTDKVSEKVLMEMLGEKPRTSVEIRERFAISREHAARVLKELFDRGIVVRNDSHKPFVYELTESGRRMISPGDRPVAQPGPS